jgi:hypothetical protein
MIQVEVNDAQIAEWRHKRRTLSGYLDSRMFPFLGRNARGYTPRDPSAATTRGWETPLTERDDREDLRRSADTRI